MDARMGSLMRQKKASIIRDNWSRLSPDALKVIADMETLSLKDDLMRKKKASRIRDWSKLRICDWSKLYPDVLRKILETLNPIDSDRAKTVCSDWYFVWKTCFRPPGTLQIIHQGEDSSRLFDPDEDKMINTRKKPVGFSNGSYCMASSGVWLLMVGFRLDFYLLNLLTRERINLPSMDSPIRGGQVRFEFEGGGSRDGRGFSDKCGYFVEPSGKTRQPWQKVHHVSKDIVEWKNSAVVWINETTGDYVVAWVFRQHYLFSYKKGDASWSNLTLKGTDSGFLDVAYRNSRLFVFTTDHHIRIFDFSGDFPNEVQGFVENPYLDHPFRFVEQPLEYIWKRKISIQKSGEVLIILSIKEVKYEEKLLFYIFRMNLESSKWERVDSIGEDEMLIFGHGVTVRAPVGDGFKSGSICFVEDDVWPDHDDDDHRGGASKCGVFNIATGTIEWHKKICFHINETQWFVPGFA